LARKRNKRHQNTDVKQPLFTDDIILYIEKSYRIPLLSEIINEYSEIDGCKINTQKSVVFLYTGNRLFKNKEIKKTIQLL
jgi:hypothetical protein